jgi:hypothetical protein
MTTRKATTKAKVKAIAVIRYDEREALKGLLAGSIPCW